MASLCCPPVLPLTEIECMYVCTMYQPICMQAGSLRVKTHLLEKHYWFHMLAKELKDAYVFPHSVVPMADLETFMNLDE